MFQRRLVLCFALVTISRLLALPSDAPIKEHEFRDVGGYVLNNNVWGKDKSPKGWEVIDGIKLDGAKLSWRVRYNWPVGTDKYAVKCYPSVVTGWQWGIWSSDGHLPREIGRLKRVATTGSVTVRNPGVQNLAYDLWFHAAGIKPDDKSKPSDELMIWMAAHGGAGPLGKLREKVRIGDTEWSLYVGDIGWKVFSFVRTTNCDSWSIDAKPFIDHLIHAGLMAPTKQLSAVQFGTEVFQSPGDAAVEVKDYEVSIE